MDDSEKKKDLHKPRSPAPAFMRDTRVEAMSKGWKERMVGGDKGPIAYRKFPKWLMWVPYLLIAATIGVLVWLVLGSLGLVKPPWLD